MQHENWHFLFLRQDSRSKFGTVRVSQYVACIEYASKVQHMSKEVIDEFESFNY